MHTIVELKNEFDRFLNSYPFIKEPEGLYIPVDYIMKLGGKRLRPLLTLVSAEMFGSPVEKALNAALAIEVFHNFTLVHDDIMDKADIRRGKDTVHKKFDVNTAILSGDVMMIQAYDILLKYNNPKIFKDLVSTFNKLAIELCEGQQWDVEFEKLEKVTVDDYLKMIGLKTGVLIAGALKLGAILSEASEADQDHIYKFGYNIGIAFQIQDDLLDTFGEAEKVGKKIGGDIVQNKKTYLYIKALELADKDQREELYKIYSGKTQLEEFDKISIVTQLFKSLVVEEYAKQVRDAYLDLAYAHLSAIDLPNENKQELRKIAQMLVQRDY